MRRMACWKPRSATRRRVEARARTQELPPQQLCRVATSCGRHSYGFLALSLNLSLLETALEQAGGLGVVPQSLPQSLKHSPVQHSAEIGSPKSSWEVIQYAGPRGCPSASADAVQDVSECYYDGCGSACCKCCY